MKHFFYCRNSESKGLLIDILSKFNNASQLDKLKILYDAADIIYDKRLPDDKELKNCIEKYKKLFSCKKAQNEVSLKYKALLSLWYYAEAQEDNFRILCHLARGNICLRISQYFYDEYDFKNSELWGDRAIEIIWHGLNIVKQNRDTARNKKDYWQMDVYLRLIQLNLSRYYMDYSRKNRRSNYASAELELENLIEKIEKIFKEKTLTNNTIKRQYALIYVEAKCNLISICRRRYHISKAYKYSKKLNQQFETKGNKTTILDCLDTYDTYRYRLLAKLDFAGIYRDKHEPKFYNKAINLALEVNELSLKLDNAANIDAIIIISSALRKSFKYSLNRDKMSKRILSLKIRTQKDKKSDLFSELNSLADRGEPNSQAELIKWYYMSIRKINMQKIKAASSFPTKEQIDVYFKKQNIQMQFLKGVFLFYSDKFNEAKNLFLKLLKKEETNYIRLGAIGLKARYLLANAYMSLGQFSKAKIILQKIHETLEEVKENRLAEEVEKNSSVQYKASETDADSDLRTVIDLIYCLMRQGDYDKAYGMYTDYYRDISKKKTYIDIIEINNAFLHRVSKSRRIAGLNNLISCCLFSANMEDINQAKKRLQTAINVFQYLEKNYGEKNDPHDYKWDLKENPETNLLYGYFILLTGQKPMQNIDWQRVFTKTQNNPDFDSLKLAHPYFELACGYKYGFFPVYKLKSEEKDLDRGYFINQVCYISAYLINLVKLYYKSKKKKLYCEAKEYAKRIEQFILGLPKKYEFSMNAAISLAEWLLEYQTNTKNKQRLLRSFYYATIYEERGAQAFNQLHANQNFRLMTSEQRGETTAYLLSMYKYIKILKEDCTYKLEGKNEKMRPLVHYTRRETLKSLLKNEGTHFRLNNCGYMNDVFEGRAFLNCMKKVVTEEKIHKDFNFQRFIEKYFPHLERSEKDMHPSGSHVYIASLSVKEDSFPLWKIYAEDETGCNIEFDDDFFDVNGSAYNNSVLRDYLPFRYTDKDYPLYIVQYIDVDSSFTKNVKSYHGKKYIQDCQTEAISHQDLSFLLKNIFKRLYKLDQYLEGLFENSSNINKRSIKHSINTVRQFAADRLNEVRFLFKSSDYVFEGEVRVIQTSEDANVNYDGVIPRVYIDVKRKIKNLTIRLGSRIDDATVDQLVTWLKHTPYVKKVQLAQRNRYTNKLID